MQYWDEVLFPDVLMTIRGERYITMSDAQINAELNALTKRAISTFKFPNVSLEYSFETLEIEDEANVQRYFFTNDDIGYREFEILIAWIKAYWAEMIVSNADNYNNLYYDSNIHTYSPGNMLHNFEKMWSTYRTQARQLESNYGRVNVDGTPAIGDVNDD